LGKQFAGIALARTSRAYDVSGETIAGWTCDDVLFLVADRDGADDI
jgi:hypothetical protein